MATSVSARRWRTAWNVAMGRPNWMRSRAWAAGQLEHRPASAPTSSWASASWARATAVGQSPASGRPGAVGSTPSPVHLDQPERRVDALDRAERRGRRWPPSTAAVRRRRRRPRPTTVVASARPRRRPRPCDQRARPRPADPAGRRRPDAGSTTPAGRADARARARSRARCRGPTSDVLAAPWQLEQQRRSPSAGRRPGRRASRARRGRRRAPRRVCRLGGVARGSARTARRSVVVHQRSAPRSSRRRAMMLRWISALPP